MSEQKRPGRYPAEMRERAVRMLFEHQGEYPSQAGLERENKKSFTGRTRWRRRLSSGRGARPPVQEVVAFIDAHRERFGVEPICRLLREQGAGIAPNTYLVAKKRGPSKRRVRDGELKVEIERVHTENLSVYGADKVWAQLNRENVRVARCTVASAMT